MNSGSPPKGTVALTGSTGFVGRALIDRLTAAGWRVKALTRQANALPPNDRVEPILGSLEDKTSLAKLVDKADAIIHSAGLTATAFSRKFDVVNSLGTSAIARAAANLSPPPKFIMISSLAARSPEISAYGASKRRGEDHLRQIFDGLDWQIIRPPAVYGPGDKGTLILFRMFAHGWALKYSRYGRFSLINIADLTAAIHTLLETQIKSGQIFELDDGQPNGHNWDAVIDQARQQFTRNIKAFVPPKALLRSVAAAATGISITTGRRPILTQDKINELIHPDWVCCNNLLGTHVDWQPQISISQGFLQTVEWYIKMGWI